MMSPFLILLSVLPVVLGRAAAPAACCIGQQFSATIDETGGRADAKTGGAFVDQSLFLQFDYTNKRTYVEGTTKVGDISYPYKVVNDYAANQTYSMVNGACYTVGPPAFPLQDPCQLTHARVVETSQLGSPSHHITVNTLALDMPGFSVKAVVTADGTCTPIMESLVGDIGGVPQQLTLFFSNYTRGITKSSVFTFDRSACGPVPTTPATQ